MVASTILIASGVGRRCADIMGRLAGELAGMDRQVCVVDCAEDALGAVRGDASLVAALVDWELPGGAESVLQAIGNRFTGLPVFLITSGTDLDKLPLWVGDVVDGYIWPDEDTPSFVAGRIELAGREYREQLMPPFFKALHRFDGTHEYSWHTPAHAGGVAFFKSPAGRILFDYYGERLFRTDLSISVIELGSLFEHTGPIGDAERNAARVFGADLTYFVLNGNSTSNRIAIGHSATRDEIVLVDRNCHKSIYHGLALTGARPVYLVPTRNGLGLMGPIPPQALGAGAIRDAVAAAGLSGAAAGPDPVYAVVTNSTYDGLCYNAIRVAELLGASTPRLHLDEAWFAHAKFHPLYERRYGMSITETTVPGPDRPTVFTTQSSHKLLAALSQAAMLHVRDSPRAPVQPHHLNETFMMHGTTSPSYPIIASLDIATAMMDGPGGRWLLDEAITEAIRFRQTVPRLARRMACAGDRPGWFFGIWQPPTVTDATGTRMPFEDAPIELLRDNPECWQLEPGAPWHGFPDLEPGYCLLDPLKVTITCPGTSAAAGLSDWGIPARILTAYLETRRIVVEKTDAYTILVLFSMGVTKGKWGTLTDALFDFKRHFDNDALLEDILPELTRRYPTRYGGLTLPQLCAMMHNHLRDADLIDLLEHAFTRIPDAEFTPSACHSALIRGRTELVRSDALAGRTAATMVVTTPPGIPVLMPGENIGPGDGPLLRYLIALESFDQNFPGFQSETHGVTRDAAGAYWIECLSR
ncbi:Orn/Lys/Arg decarboxylase N-terminal domain-containing protein [Nocardia sp. NBC_01327]|uniref:Orn/Lys/Arg family decarboxylase n=1 Tax=Nocardia sp. NBC_01327 TaxID=2903593 RepID=UPI002E145A56|nr:hypothetical protein OG326_06165 [Nocardia sp. NBC_01327]